VRTKGRINVSIINMKNSCDMQSKHKTGEYVPIPAMEIYVEVYSFNRD